MFITCVVGSKMEYVISLSQEYSTVPTNTLPCSIIGTWYSKEIFSKPMSNTTLKRAVMTCRRRLQGYASREGDAVLLHDDFQNQTTQRADTDTGQGMLVSSAWKTSLREGYHLATRKKK